MTKHRVLIPLDGSEFSRQILPQVQQLLNPADNELILLTVGELPKGFVGRPTRPASADVPTPMYESAHDAEFTLHPIYDSQEYESAVGAIMDQLQPEKLALTEAGYTVYTAVKFGSAANEIVNFVEAEDIDLIAMTTHGRSGLSRLVFGSVAGHVLRNVAVPIMLLRPFVPLPPDNFPSDVVAAGRAMRG